MIADAASDRPAHRRPASSVPVDGFLDILLVEDDPEDVRLLLDLIPSRPEPELELRFTVARSLAEATNALDSDRFDAVALDLSLPDAQGLTGLHALKRVAPQVPVVVVTGAQNHQLAQLAIAAGAQDYLVKGVDAANAFARSIRYAIERQQLFRERDDVAALLRQRAEQLMTANARLTAAADARDELVAVVSHELRTPLTPISGFTETLQRRLAGRISDEESEMLAAIDRNATRLRAHVEQLLSVSELTLAGQLPSDRATVRVAELLQRVAGDQLDAAGAMVVDAEPTLTIHTNELHAEQIVTNLLVNARKYGRPPVHLAARADGRHTAIAVTDHGDGVPPDFVPQLFDRFSQASTGTRRTASGVGLGLHVARRLALLHGGDLTYEPLEGTTGARFVLRLPATAASVPTTGDAEHAAALDSEAVHLGLVVASAARRMLHATDERTVAGIVEEAIEELDGSVMPADAAGPHALPVDVSLGRHGPRLVVPADALAGARLQRLLPGIMDDARRAITTIRNQGERPSDSQATS